MSELFGAADELRRRRLQDDMELRRQQWEAVQQMLLVCIDPAIELKLHRNLEMLESSIAGLARELGLLGREREAVGVTRVDVAIITALEDERIAVLSHLPDHRRLSRSEDNIDIYYEATLPVQHLGNGLNAYHLIVCQIPAMGRIRAAVTASNILRRFRPRYLLVVGIAGGIADRGVAPGDLLISTQIVDYELQKLTPDDEQMRWEVHRSDEGLCNQARHLPDSWRQAIKQKHPTNGIPKCHFGPVASGDKVVAFETVLRRYRTHWPQLIGVEMEAAGVATTAFTAAPPVPFFMVRGVSDLADRAKDDRWRLYACDVAAAFTVTLLNTGPIPTGRAPGA